MDMQLFTCKENMVRLQYKASLPIVKEHSSYDHILKTLKHNSIGSWTISQSGPLQALIDCVT